MSPKRAGNIKIAIATVIFVAVTFYSEWHAQKKKDDTLKWKFKGPVQQVWYDEKAFPTVVVNGKKYDLYNAIWNFGIKIRVGDTIFKDSGDFKVKLIRKNSIDTIYEHTDER